MRTEVTHLAKLFKVVEAIRSVVEQDCHMPDMEATSIDDLVCGFEAYYGKKYNFYQVPDLSGEMVRGMVLRYTDRTDIYLDRSMSDDWMKYIQVKEMCCTILTEEKYVTKDPGALIEMMIHEETEPRDGDAPLDLVSDLWAKLAAHELLFPYAVRTHWEEKIESGEASLFTVSEIFGVPETVIESCLRPWAKDLCAMAWELAKNLPDPTIFSEAAE